MRQRARASCSQLLPLALTLSLAAVAGLLAALCNPADVGVSIVARPEVVSHSAE